MTVWEGIKQMRLLSQKKEPFSFCYVSYSISHQKSEGFKRVHNGLLTLRETEHQNKYSEHFLSYKNLDTDEVRHFWQPLLIEFDGNMLELT